MSKVLDAVLQLKPQGYQQIAMAWQNAGFYVIDSEPFAEKMIYAYKNGQMVISTSNCGVLNVSLENVPKLIAELNEVYEMLKERKHMNVKGA